MSEEEEYPLVCCKDCGALRSSRWEKCFCGETATRPAPPADKTVEERLFETLAEHDARG